MEEIVLRKLDEMFRDLREEIAVKHMHQVHQQPKEHHDSCLSASGANLSRRHSLPVHVSGQRDSPSVKSVYQSLSSSAVRRGSLPDGDNTKQTNRRSSLPTYTQSRHGTSSEIQKQHHGSARRDSTSSNPQQRKFSRDSIDLDLVIEDVDEMDTEADDIDNSIILEEDEDNVDYEVLKANKYCKIDETYSFFKQFPF